MAPPPQNPQGAGGGGGGGGGANSLGQQLSQQQQQNATGAGAGAGGGSNAPLKKRTPSAGYGVGANNNTAASALAAAAAAAAAEEADIPVIIYPEWNDAEIAAEKWGGGKHVFEDPDGPLPLPRSLRGSVESQKRIVELLQITIQQQQQQQLMQQQQLQSFENTGKAAAAASAAESVPVGVQTSAGLDDMFFSLAPVTSGGLGGGMNAGHGLHGNNLVSTDGLDPSSEVGVAATDPTSDTSSSADASITNSSGAALPTTSVGEESQSVAAPQLSSSEDSQSLQSSTTTAPATIHQTVAEDENSASQSQQQQQPQSEGTNGGAIAADPLLSSGASKFHQHNRHLHSVSDLMRSILAAYHFLYEQSRNAKSQGVPDEFCPWDALWPKGKDGLPMYNPAGKYSVKLHWLGAWRRVTVDDRVPIDEFGKPLLITSTSPQEIWPLLICKALVKIASASHREAEGQPEHGDFDPLHALKAFIPERLNVRVPSIITTNSTVGGLWDALASLNLKFTPNQRNAGSFMSVNAGTASGTQGAGKADPRASVMDRADRSNLRSAGESRGGARGNPVVFIFAARDPEDAGDKVDVGSLVRICEFKEHVAMGANGTPADKELIFTQRLIKFKSLVSCGSIRARKLAEKGKPSEEIDDGLESWLTYNDFCRTYRFVTIYHNSSSFKTIRSMQCIVDPAKPSDVIRIPQILYLPDSSKSAAVIMSVSTFGRCKSEGPPQITSVVVEPYEWTGLEVVSSATIAARRKPVLRVCTNAILASYIDVPAGRRAFKFAVDCPTSYQISFHSRTEFCLEDEGKYFSEKLGLHVRDIDEGFSAQQSNSWFILFKNVVKFVEPTVMAALLYVPDSMQSSTCVRVYDNDTNEEVPQVFYSLRPRMYNPNKSGYVVLADCRTTTSRPAGKWKLRLVSEPVPIVTPERPLEISIRPQTQDFEDAFVANKHNILFRYVVKQKDLQQDSHLSAQLIFSLPMVWVKLQVFDNDVELACAKGKGIVTLHSIALLPSPGDDSAPTANSGATQTASSNGGGGAKKEDKAEKKEREERERAAREAREAAAAAAAAAAKGGSMVLPPPPPVRHKYIVQGSVEQIELARITSPAAGGTGGVGVGEFGAGNRPGTSRAGTPGTLSAPKTTNSAKKKKASVAVISPNPATTAGGGDAQSAALATSGQGVSNEPPAWKLRLIATDSTPIVVARDTEKEDRYRAIKDSWEAAQPGRSSKAREARESYSKQVETGIIRPIVIAAGLQAIAPAAGTATPVAKSSDLVYKPWTIIKENGANGRQIATYRDKTNLTVFSADGHRIAVEPLAPSSQPIPTFATYSESAGVVSGSSGGSAGSGRKSLTTPRAVPEETVQPAAPGPTGPRPGSGLAVDTTGRNDRKTSMIPGSLATSATTLQSALGPLSSGVSLGSDEKLFETTGSKREPSLPASAVPIITPRVLSPEERSSRERERDEKISQYEVIQDQIRAARLKDREARQRARGILIERLDDVMREAEKEREEDAARREAYRLRVIKEQEEATRRAIEAQKAAELAALELSNAEEQAAGSGDKEKKKKGKK